MQKELIEYNVGDVVEFPKNEVLEGVVLSIELKKSQEIFGDKAYEKDKDVLVVSYEVKGHNLHGIEYFNYFPKGLVPDRSKLGKFLKRYENLKVGTIVKVDFDAEGNYKILL